jgi:hypothetical protein
MGPSNENAAALAGAAAQRDFEQQSRGKLTPASIPVQALRSCAACMSGYRQHQASDTLCERCRAWHAAGTALDQLRAALAKAQP